MNDKFIPIEGGGGKYGPECEEIFKKTCHNKIGGVLLMIVGGTQGNGFSCCMTHEVAMGIPKILRQVADQIEDQMKQAKAN